MNPDFQRAHVWSSTQQTAYVEYILKGGASGKDIYFNNYDYTDSTAQSVVVDGKQRLTAVREFMAGRLPIFDGHFVSDFDDSVFRIHVARFHFIVNNLPTKALVLQWYLELNTGGVLHTSEELDRVREMLRKETAGR